LKIFLLVSFFFLAMTQSAAYAGAWVQEKGNGLGILSLKWYESNRYWDKDRDLVDGGYRKWELNPFLEYGLTGRTTVGMSLFIIDVNDDRRSAPGLSDAEIFARYLLWKGRGGVLSTQLLVKVPGPYESENIPYQGQDQYDLEWRLLYGTGGVLPASGSEWYLNTEAGFRRRFGDPADEVRIDLAAGVRGPGKKWELELKQENITGLRNASGPSAPDYDLHKIGLSSRYWINQSLALQLGVTRDIYGRNTGQGTAVQGALWVRF